MKSKQYDYWALGHIHKRQQLSEHPPIIYSGNTQGRSSKENGPKGCEWVTLTDTKEEIIFYPTAPIQWERIELSIKDLKTLNEVYQLIQETITHKKNKAYSLFLSIALKDTTTLLEGVRKKINNGELIEALQQIPKETGFVWVYQIELTTDKEEKTTYVQLFPEEWQKALKEIEQEANFNELTNSFFDYAEAAELLETRDQLYREKILENAKQQVQFLLGFEGSDENEN